MPQPWHVGATWHKVRRLVLERDEATCRIRSPRCTVRATVVDHIVSPMDGGAWYDPDNLRAACGPCNSARGARTRDARRTSVTNPGPSRVW